MHCVTLTVWNPVPPTPERFNLEWRPTQWNLLEPCQICFDTRKGCFYNFVQHAERHKDRLRWNQTGWDYLYAWAAELDALNTEEGRLKRLRAKKLLKNPPQNKELKEEPVVFKSVVIKLLNFLKLHFSSFQCSTNLTVILTNHLVCLILCIFTWFLVKFSKNSFLKKREKTKGTKNKCSY